MLKSLKRKVKKRKDQKNNLHHGATEYTEKGTVLGGSQREHRILGPHLDRAAVIGFFVDLRRRMFESRRIGTSLWRRPQKIL